MAVYKRSYRGYAGGLTPQWSRFLVVSRYASQGNNKIRLGIMIIAWIPFLVTALMLYILHNSALLATLHASAGIDIGARFFRNYMSIQLGFCFLIAATTVGPGMISPDLTNNALVLYLCRPASRAVYLLGKFTAIARVLSRMTWIPGLLLFAIQASLEGWRWGIENVYIAVAIFASSWVAIGVIALLSLAMSAWVKWRPVAGGLVLMTVFLGAGFGAAINGILRTTAGSLISIPALMGTVWANLFRLEPPSNGMPIGEAWVGLALVVAVCLWLLTKKIRAYEVIG